mgnify:CR=1 FL=1
MFCANHLGSWRAIRDDPRVEIPTVTALYGALNAIFNIGLAAHVSVVRRRENISMGLGSSEALLVASRVHANNAEFVPLGILMLLLAELCGGSSFWLHIAGGLLFLGRLAHAYGLPRPAPNVFRVFGTAATWGVIVALSAWTLWLRR